MEYISFSISITFFQIIEISGVSAKEERENEVHENEAFDGHAIYRIIRTEFTGQLGQDKGNVLTNGYAGSAAP